MQYRVYYSHCGDASAHETWECKDDQEALAKFKKTCACKQNAWGDLKIERIDVVEQTTTLAYGDASFVTMI